jgi:tetratricopeptide (TPR) repeat protein
MGPAIATARDVFILHTKADAYESKLVEAIKDRLYEWGLTAWVYEDWDWEKEAEAGPRWRSYGRMDQLDPVRHAMGTPERFEHRSKGPQPDRDILAWMFERCGAIVLVAPRGGHASAGTLVELEVLQREAHAAVTSVSWGSENERLIEGVGVFFDYRMESAFPRDLSVAAETITRLAWLACMMSRLSERGAMGRDLCRQLARRDALLNRIAQHAIDPAVVPLEPDPLSAAVVADKATAETCAPILELWLGGPGYTADQLTSGKPPAAVIEASKLMRGMLHDWCARAQARFPALRAPSAKINFTLGAATMRLGKFRDAIEAFTKALAAPDAKSLQADILLNRGLAWSERSFPGKAIDDYTEALQDEGLHPALRTTLLLNRALVWAQAGKHREAEGDLDEILRSPELDAQSEALALINRADVRRGTDRPEDAIADYSRIIGLKKAPVEARLKALLNRGALQAQLQRHGAAISDYDDVLQMREPTARQITLALLNRAYSKSRSDDRDGARADYEAALEQPDLDEGVRTEIGRLLAAL